MLKYIHILKFIQVLTQKLKNLHLESALFGTAVQLFPQYQSFHHIPTLLSKRRYCRQLQSLLASQICPLMFGASFLNLIGYAECS